MLTFKQFIIEQEEAKKVTAKDLHAIEIFADRLFKSVGVDINFTKHFLDRANDPRNKKQISVGELVRLWKQTYKKYGKKIPKLGRDAEAVLQDMQTDINVPFVLKWDNRAQEFDLVAKTIMRKKGFHSPDQKLKV